MPPKTKYAKSGDIHIAFQVNGDGPIDLVFVPGFVSHVEYIWEHPRVAYFFKRLSAFSRLIHFDKRGTGLSDRVPDVPTLEQRMDDVRAVMDAVGSERAALFGVSEGGPMGLLFSATHPERTSDLILLGSYARRSWAPNYPFGWTEEDWHEALESIDQDWGGSRIVELIGPSLIHDAGFSKWMSDYYRLAASPGAAIAVWEMNKEIDVRHILPAVRVPTLILHRTEDRFINVEHGRFLAKHIRNSKFVELPGIDHAYWSGDVDSILDEIEEFLTGARQGPGIDRVLTTVLFIDIVGSTEHVAILGDRRWREMLQGYYGLARRELLRFRGREVNTAGDGLLATFDGPARAIQCAMAIRAGVSALGVEIRAGLHTGECEVIGEDLAGIAIHIGARVAAEAGSGEVLVSSTVKDLVTGSGIRFQDRGYHSLRGVPGEWRLFIVK